MKKQKKKNVKSLETEHETIMCAIEALQKVLQVDFKSNQCEVAVVSVKNPAFRVLSEKEIDKYLTELSEKD